LDAKHTTKEKRISSTQTHCEEHDDVFVRDDQQGATTRLSIFFSSSFVSSSSVFAREERRGRSRLREAGRGFLRVVFYKVRGVLKKGERGGLSLLRRKT
jgi:hypothetical protein